MVRKLWCTGVHMTLFKFLIMTGFSCSQHDALEYTRRQVLGVETSLIAYHLDNGRYPTTEEGLRMLAKTNRPRSTTTYIRELTDAQDGWSRQILYFSPGIHAECTYEILSYGEDGRPGGSGTDVDIVFCGRGEKSGWLSGGPG